MVTWNTPYKHSLVCQSYFGLAVSSALKLKEQQRYVNFLINQKYVPLQKKKYDN